MGNVKLNVVIGSSRTSVTVNSDVFHLLEFVDGTPSLQDLIDDSERLGYVPQGNRSSWVTSLIAVSLSLQLSS